MLVLRCKIRRVQALVPQGANAIIASLYSCIRNISHSTGGCFSVSCLDFRFVYELSDITVFHYFWAEREGLQQHYPVVCLLRALRKHVVLCISVQHCARRECDHSFHGDADSRVHSAFNAIVLYGRFLPL
jgi:hypothetical protein